MNYEQHAAEDARLTILRELAAQIDYRLNENVLTGVLRAFGHNRSREWVRTQLLKLKELGAVDLTEAGSVFVAELKAAGLDHVERRGVIEGIARPSPGR